jgi:hypothetical protein
VPWLTPIILATQEAEIWRIEVQSQSGQIVQETLSQKHLTEKKGWWMVQGLGPEFKSQYSKKKKKRREPYQAQSVWEAIWRNSLE